ncbi:hypothetical protein NDU88_001470 [Pleurodeles waltl]|uniref:Uncharacterized protein n=1 Tax=Pleurodeles waltl TaxID=8319 RepID=A0AAV7WKZ0_PLEWA|nr:hypothetical protein NDU88_001470 [Pleurodeles waltl]
MRNNSLLQSSFSREETRHGARRADQGTPLECATGGATVASRRGRMALPSLSPEHEIRCRLQRALVRLAGRASSNALFLFGSPGSDRAPAVTRTRARGRW